MAYSDDEKEYLKLVIEGSINTAMKPVMEHLTDNALQLQRHEQSLYGVTGDNGLNGDMKTIKGKVETLEGYKKQVIAIAGTVGAFASAAGTLITKKLFGG